MTSIEIVPDQLVFYKKIQVVEWQRKAGRILIFVAEGVLIHSISVAAETHIVDIETFHNTAESYPKKELA